jgi:hypothetical protein
LLVVAVVVVVILVAAVVVEDSELERAFLLVLINYTQLQLGQVGPVAQPLPHLAIQLKVVTLYFHLLLLLAVVVEQMLMGKMVALVDLVEVVLMASQEELVREVEQVVRGIHLAHHLHRVTMVAPLTQL